MTRKREPVSSIWHSTVSPEYQAWKEKLAYLKANGYLDVASIEMMCEECGITVSLHEFWATQEMLDESEKRYPNL